jgi:mannose-6-phosphate isomerase-like protein (cupin superfamily)
MKKIRCGMVGVSLLVVAAIAFVAAEAQTPTPAAGLEQSRGYGFDEMALRKAATGTESRSVLNGVLKTGEAVGVHESMEPAGTEPVAMHVIQHSELIMVQQGTVGFEHDGKTEKVAAGGVIYVAIGTLHRIKNVGDGPAKYFVVQVGGDTRKE